MVTAAQPAPDFRALLETPISWTESADPEIPWTATFGDLSLAIRLNDFPDEVMFTLLVNGKPLDDFDDWPPRWTRPATASA